MIGHLFGQRASVYDKYTKPGKFDCNLVVIGGGSAGLICGLIAASVKAKVTLVESGKMGGDCLNTGCVPSKALIKTAKLIHMARHSEKYGIKRMDTEVDFEQVMQRVSSVIKKIEPHDSVERFTELGVDVAQGRAKIKTPWEVEVALNDENGNPTGETRTITTRNIVVAAGAEPLVPPIPGLDKVGVLTSDTIWEMKSLPKRMLVLGGGPIGCELAQSFRRLGAEVTLVEMAPNIMGREDPEIADMVRDQFITDGVDVRVNHKAVRFEDRGTSKVLMAEQTDANGNTVEIEFDGILCALGRKARLTGYGLEELGVTANRTVEVNDFLETNYPNIYAAGDVAGPYQFTHTASHMAWFSTVNALFGRFWKFKVDYRVIPWATFTDPEVARVGLNETEAKEKGIAYEVATYGIDDLDRAIADSVDHGVVKILTVPGKDKILGVTIAGEHAGDLIAEFVTAMKYNLGLKKIMGTIHIYPTLVESNKMAAGVWQKAHIPEKLLSYVKRLHAWERD